MQSHRRRTARKAGILDFEIPTRQSVAHRADRFVRYSDRGLPTAPFQLAAAQTVQMLQQGRFSRSGAANQAMDTPRQRIQRGTLQGDMRQRRAAQIFVREVVPSSMNSPGIDFSFGGAIK